MIISKLVNLKCIFGLALLLAPSISSAQEINGANTAWILTSTALVLFMTLPGLSLFYGGLVRTKNVLSVLMQCFAIAVTISILWLIVGYSIAFGPSESAYWGGLSRMFFSGIDINSMSGDIPETVFAGFQMTFAIITPALIVGAFVERIKFSSMLIFSILWTLIVYFPVANWVWGGGWLGSMGLIDFAGGTVVHVTAGVGALVTALVIGQRKEFGQTATLPHNLTMSFTGAAMLWVGWFGFNAGSALAADGAAGMALFVTHISAATGALTWMGYRVAQIRQTKWLRCNYWNGCWSRNDHSSIWLSRASRCAASWAGRWHYLLLRYNLFKAEPKN